MSGGRLLVVATPIGNLGDLSPRAAEVLRTAAVVLAEDTRRTKVLLDHAGSRARLVSCHQHNEAERVPLVVERTAAGDDVAFVTDAGAPGVSDPGGRLVALAVERGVAVEVVPGPSALVAALMGAGLVSHRFAFLGFLPRRGGARRALLAQAGRGLALVLFEAPGRVAETLQLLAGELGPRRVVVARELTKKFETFHRGVLGGELSPPLVDKGEAVIVVEAGGEAEEAAPVADAARVLEQARADESLTPKQRAKQVAKALGIPPREAYARLTTSPGVEEEALPAGEAPVARAVAVSLAPRRLVAARLADAARALVDADEAAARARGIARGGERAERGAPVVESGIAGADELMAFLERSSALPAPVEAAELARAILAALSAADALDGALDGALGSITSE